MNARLADIYISAERGAPMQRRSEAVAVAGRGLMGDRYAAGRGTFSKRFEVHRGARELSIVHAQALTECNRILGSDFELIDLRRNLVVTGMDLQRAIGQSFLMGEIAFEILGTCPPCGYLSRLLGADMRRGLANRGGVRARVLHGGTLRVGDKVLPHGIRE